MKPLRRKTRVGAEGAIRPLCVAIDEAADMLAVGRTKIYALIGAGELDIVKIGRSTRVTTSSLDRFVLNAREAIRRD